jgi:hypothetical protein
MSYRELKGLVVEGIDLDHAVALAAYGELMTSHYAKHQQEVPDWLTNNVKALNDEIHRRGRDNLERALKEAEAEATRLLTADEKRKANAEKIERLKKALGK